MRDKIMEFANSQIGIQEEPAGSNIVKYNDWYYDEDAVGVPIKNYKGAAQMYHSGKKRGNAAAFAWCGTFTAYIYNFAGAPMDKEINYRAYYVPMLQNYLQANGYKVNFEDAKPGDLILFDWDKNGREDHVGLVVGFDGTYFTTIEGNTSSDDKGSQSNGGMVCLKRRHKGTVEGCYNILDK